MANGNGQQPPPQLSDDAQLPPGSVGPTKKERALGVVGAIAGGGKRDFRDSPLGDALNKAYQRHAQEAEFHYKQYSTWLSMSHLKPGTTNPQTKEPITQEDIEKWKVWAENAKEMLLKTPGLNKELKAKIQMGIQKAEAVAPVVAQKGGQSQPASAGAAPAAGGSQAPASGGTTPPPQYLESLAEEPQARQGLEAQRKTQETMAGETAEVERRKKLADELKIPPGSLGYQEYVATGKFPLQAHLQKTIYVDPNDPNRVPKEGSYDPSSGQITDQEGNVVSGAIPATLASMTPKRFTYIGPNGEPLIGMQVGTQFMDQEGNPLPPNTEVYMRGAVPTETLRQVVTIGPDGNPQINTLETIRMPFKLGKKPAGGSAPTEPRKPAGGGARSSGTPPPQVSDKPQAKTAPAAGEKDARGKPLGLPPGMYNAQLKRSTAIREASVQAFGDPTNPNFKPLKEFARLADDQESQKRLGTALKLTFDGLEQEEKAHGSFIGLLQAYGGVPQALAEAKAGIQKEVIDALTPEEQDAFDATISAFSSFSAARSLTSASAAQFSVKALERDIPIIGVTATSSRMFYDKLGRMGEIIYSGSKGTSGVAMPQPEKDYLLKQLEEVNKLKQGGSRSSATPPPQVNATIDQEIKDAVKAAKGAGNRASAKPSPQPQL